MFIRWLFAGWLCLTPLFAGGVRGDEAQEVEVLKKYQAYAKETAAKYELTTTDEVPRQLKLRRDAFLRWTNPLGGNKGHGELFLWTDHGRPAAVLSLNEWTDVKGIVHEQHEWCSLAFTPIQATGPNVWLPSRAGLELKVLPAAPKPADTPTRRLQQMRDLADGFSGLKTTREDVTRPLRLLRQPAYRYEAAGDPDVLDGGLFALVEATDPEILLCIEARLVDGKPVWHYGLGRLNSVRLTVSFQGSEIWRAEMLPFSEVRKPSEPYMAFSR